MVVWVFYFVVFTLLGGLTTFVCGFVYDALVFDCRLLFGFGLDGVVFVIAIMVLVCFGGCLLLFECV